MSMRAREMKWAVGGFVGGFLLCYILLGAFRVQPPAPGLLTKAAPITARPTLPAVVTNIQTPELRIIGPDRWLGPTLPTDPRQPGRSLDLIDTHYQLPQPPEKP